MEQNTDKNEMVSISVERVVSLVDRAIGGTALQLNDQAVESGANLGGGMAGVNKWYYRLFTNWDGVAFTCMSRSRPLSDERRAEFEKKNKYDFMFKTVKALGALYPYLLISSETSDNKLVRLPAGKFLDLVGIVDERENGKNAYTLSTDRLLKVVGELEDSDDIIQLLKDDFVEEVEDN